LNFYETEDVIVHEMDLKEFTTAMKPLLIVQIKKPTDFLNIFIHQNFIARTFLVKQIRVKEKGEKIK